MTTTADHPLLDQAQAAIPGVPEAQVALDSVDEDLRTARAGFVAVDVVEDTLAALLEGKPLPTDLGERALSAVTRAEVHQARVTTLQRLADRLQYRRRDLLADGADTGLGVLAGTLEQILTAARRVFTDLGPAGTAQQAIDAGTAAATAWGQVGPLTARHQELRSAQGVLVSAALYPPERPGAGSRVTPATRRLVDTYGTVRNYATLYPDPQPWDRPEREQLGEGVRQSRIVNDVETSQRHESRPTHTRPWLTGDPVADLRWLCGPQAQPWVPSIRALQAAVSEAEQRRKAAASEEAAGPPHPGFRRGSRGGIAFTTETETSR